MKANWVVSLFIHAPLILLAVIAGGNETGRSPEPVTITLSNEVFVERKGGGGGGEISASPGLPHKTPRIAKVKDKDRGATMPSNEQSETVFPGIPLPDSPGHGMVGHLSGHADGGTGSGGHGTGSGQAGGGSGHGSGNGTGETKDSRQAQYLKEHFHYIREMILGRIVYPVIAKKMGWKGEVIVSFVISETGGAENIKIIKSSGHGILDENVVKVIRRVQPFPRPPVRAKIIIPVVYNIG